MRMTPAYSAATLTAFVAACAHPITPQGVVAFNSPTEYTLKRGAEDAAACMTRNINNREASAGFLVASTLSGELAGTFEVVGRISGTAAVMVAIVEPLGGGSHATVWQNPVRWGMEKIQPTSCPTQSRGADAPSGRCCERGLHLTGVRAPVKMSLSYRYYRPPR